MPRLIFESDDSELGWEYDTQKYVHPNKSYELIVGCPIRGMAANGNFDLECKRSVAFLLNSDGAKKVFDIKTTSNYAWVGFDENNFYIYQNNGGSNIIDGDIYKISIL